MHLGFFDFSFVLSQSWRRLSTRILLSSVRTSHIKGFHSRPAIMEREFAELTLDDDDETVLQAQIESNLEKEERNFRLVGCF